VTEHEEGHGRFAVPGDESHESDETLSPDERDDERGDERRDEPQPGTPVEPKRP
jgi:hypothetical protein